MFDILQVIPGKKKLTHSGWHSFNAVCCHYRGHSHDERGRGGVKFDGQNWSYHCFNCGFTANFFLGSYINKKTKTLLHYCGLDEDQISKWNLESIKHRDLITYVTKKKEKLKVKFDEMALPLEAELLDNENESHKTYIDYLISRKINYSAYPFMVTPEARGRQANRIIIPYTFKNKIVGHTSRYLDNHTPKFINEQQQGYVFGYDLQKPEWEVCIVTEGIFDALSLNACALMHNAINDKQAEVLKSLERKIIVVPDHDKAGLQICDRALDLGFHVSIPDWDLGVKDVNDAVIKYGQLSTLLSILQSATNSKIKLEMQRKKLDRQL